MANNNSAPANHNQQHPKARKHKEASYIRGSKYMEMNREGDSMDCCICGPMASVYRPPRNTICNRCYEGGRSMASFLKEFKGEQQAGILTNTHGFRHSTATKGISDAFEWMKEMKEKEEMVQERMGFLESFFTAVREGIHTDILVKPSGGAPIPAHRALLASKSEIFRTMLSCDECKAPAGDTIFLPDLNHDDLRCLLEFLYRGELPALEKSLDERCRSLLIAGDKYDIPFLRSFCERRILRSLTPANALVVLEVSERCSSGRLREQALDAIVRHPEDVVMSAEYETFVARNAHLGVEITRALLMYMKAKAP